ncbi:hypothetical protein P691DRAFT_788870 [Macrolepiota fuliginosa MF-IS2]|uniref:Uncharacterized protein n=1 Tax=Macrolepiota fuliginosa MF-IS2 TaxID=1400762 RepID=A0A9P5X145_9AGAR|nr:hypothetical protein P691DRAFT_788870 [Macrolepiota fuliginosa MF-IS2]
MNFVQVDEAGKNIDTSAPIEVDDDEGTSVYDELSPMEELTNSITWFGMWSQNNTITDSNEHDNLMNNIKKLVELFKLIPAPHCCPPPPPPCAHLHQVDALPCPHLHVEDALPPPPCQCPHCDDKEIPMIPTHVFNEAALQTLAPSHEASSPPPLPAAVASIPTDSPCGQPSYAGAVAKNLNPAAPPFVCGPPCAPVQPPAQAQQPISSKRSKQLFYVMCGPSQHQFFIEAPSIPKDTSLLSMVKMANTALVHAKSTL